MNPIFWVPLADQISENNIQDFLVGLQFPKSENLVTNPEIFLTFMLVGLVLFFGMAAMPFLSNGLLLTRFFEDPCS